MYRLRLIFTALFLPLLFTSCVKKDYYYNDPPPPPVGFTYIFNDDFNGDLHGWTFSDPANYAYGQVSNGEYTFSYQAGGNGTYSTVVPTAMNPDDDWLIQTRIESNMAMALNFGVGNNEYGYSFFIDQSGYFAVFDEGSPSIVPSTLLDWTYEPNLLAGYNSVEIEQVGNRWFGYINNKQVFNLPARTLYGTSVGFLNMAGTTGYADYLTVKSY